MPLLRASGVCLYVYLDEMSVFRKGKEKVVESPTRRDLCVRMFALLRSQSVPVKALSRIDSHVAVVGEYLADRVITISDVVSL